MNVVFIMYCYFEVIDKLVFLVKVGVNICGIVMCGEFGVNCVMIEVLLKFEVISVYGVGFDVVDFVVVCECGICVINIFDVLIKDVVDFGVVMMFV